jgi:hypothetical protein
MFSAIWSKFFFKKKDGFENGSMEALLKSIRMGLEEASQAIEEGGVLKGAFILYVTPTDKTLMNVLRDGSLTIKVCSTMGQSPFATALVENAETRKLVGKVNPTDPDEQVEWID